MHLPIAHITTAQHFIQAFSWMLLHSLWQGLLLALITALVLSVWRRSSSVIRYNLVLAQFLLFVAASICTFIWQWQHTQLAAAVHNNVSPGNIAVQNAATIKHFADAFLRYFSANAPVVVLLWLILFIFRAVRMMGGMVYIHRARRRHIFQPADEWKIKLDILCKKLQLKKAVQLLESGYVKMPVVIGNLRPIILIPVGLLAGLPAGQIEAILLHELAHIRRHDYFINFLQALTETVFFFNPGLLWVSSLLRDERENCCDDIALDQTKNKKEFIQALISFKEHALYGTNYQVAFPGKKDHLLNRVSRIISNQNKAFGTAEKAFFMAGIIILSGIVATAAVSGAAGPGFHRVHQHIAKPAADVRPIVAWKPAKPSGIVQYEDVARLAAKKERERRVLADAKPNATSDVTIPQITASADMKQPALTNRKHITEEEQARLDADQAARDEIQAIRDQEQAKKDQAQAILDQEQATKDKEQASRDQAEVSAEKQERESKNAEQDKLNKIQAKRNQEQAARNEQQALKNKEQERLNKIQEERNNEQVARNNEQAARNNEQARLNQLQAEKNKEQARLNEVQAKKNEAQHHFDEMRVKSQLDVKIRSSVSVQN